MLSQADIEIFKAAQLQERKELKKKLKAEVEDLVAAELKKQANNVQIKNLEELFDLKLTLLDEVFFFFFFLALITLLFLFYQNKNKNLKLVKFYG